MRGKFKAPIHFEPGYEELFFTIKKGKGILSRLNQFAKKLVRIHENYQSGPFLPKTITADISMKNSIEKIVPELESKTGEHFEVKYIF